MISEFFLNIIFGIASGALSAAPDITFSVDSSVFEFFVDILKMACYLLPMGTVNTIVGIIIAVSGFRVVIAIIRSVWDLLPLV